MVMLSAIGESGRSNQKESRKFVQSLYGKTAEENQKLSLMCGLLKQRPFVSQLGLEISEIKMFCARMTTACLPTSAPGAVTGEWTCEGLLLKAHSENIVFHHMTIQHPHPSFCLLSSGGSSIRSGVGCGVDRI